MLSANVLDLQAQVQRRRRVRERADRDVVRPGLGVTANGLERDTARDLDLRPAAHSLAHAARFRRFFQNVAYEPRYALCISSEEFIKQADQYGLKFETDFVDYLRSLSFKERRAFDMAMGYVFGKISDLNIRLPTSGLYVFLKASDAPLGSFYNEHRDRRALYATAGLAASLDRSPAVTFDDGWYEPNLLPPIARWMSRSGKIGFDSSQVSEITLDLTTHMPDLRTQPLELEFLLNGERLSCFALLRRAWLNLHLFVPEGLNSEVNGKFELEIRANRTWQPRPTNDERRDDRELSIAVCNIEVRTACGSGRLI